jgi:hypothetical protein
MASNSVSYRNNVAVDAVLITLDDNADIATSPCGAFMVGAAGALKVTTAEGTTLLLPYVAAGVPIGLRVKRFWSTTSTATGVVALY